MQNNMTALGSLAGHATRNLTRNIYPTMEENHQTGQGSNAW